MSVPPPELQHWMPLISDFIRRVQQAWWLAGMPRLYLTSWYRDPAHNAASGGDPYSLHLVGLAIDVQGAAQDLDDFAEGCRLADLHYLQESSHLHVQRFATGYLRSLFG